MFVYVHICWADRRLLVKSSLCSSTSINIYKHRGHNCFIWFYLVFFYFLKWRKQPCFFSAFADPSLCIRSALAINPTKHIHLSVCIGGKWDLHGNHIGTTWEPNGNYIGTITKNKVNIVALLRWCRPCSLLIPFLQSLFTFLANSVEMFP